MFRRSSEPLALSEASLLALRPALNAPVLNTDFLPVGPARAAIVVFAEEYGGIGLAIGVRSNEGGQIAVFRNQQPIDADTKLEDALEPALASAERMGFLFDEDMVESVPGGDGRVQAMALWGRLMGELETPLSPGSLDANGDSLTGSITSSSLSSLEEVVPELLLDEVAPLELSEMALDFEEELQPVESAPPVTPAQQPLSKFRTMSAESSPESDSMTAASQDANSSDDRDKTEGRSELGRIPLVRIRQRGAKRVPFLARVLSSF